MQDILNDKSDAKQNTHLKLKLNLSENKDFICTNQTYQIKQLENVAKAYGVKVVSKNTKKNICKLISEIIPTIDSIPHPENLQDETKQVKSNQPLTSEENSQPIDQDPVVQLVFNLTLRYLYRVVKYSNDVILNLTLKLCCSTKFYCIVS